MFAGKNIDEVIDSEDMKYLNNKYQGGENNRKGNEYEFKYCMIKIYEAGEKYFNEGLDYTVYYQPKCFVDDLIFYHKTEKADSYQIKDVLSLGWNTGKHTLKEDFEKQYKLCVKLGFPEDGIKTYIVVSREEISKSLKDDIPNEIEDYSEVEHFENKELYEYRDQYREQISILTATKNPEDDDLDYIQKIIYGTWINLGNNKKIKFSEFYAVMKTTKDFIIRSEPFKLPEEISKMLLSIEGFSFDTSRGHFNWWFYGGFGNETGIIHKENLEVFYKLAKLEKPRTFEELEGLL